MAFRAKFRHPQGMSPENQEGVLFGKKDIEVRVINGMVQKQDGKWFVVGQVQVYNKGIPFWTTNVRVNTFDHEQPFYKQLYEKAKEAAVEFRLPGKEEQGVALFEDIEDF